MTKERTLKQAGLALRAARLGKDMRQAELSRLLGIDRTQVARYETGKAPVPPCLLQQYAAALGITPEAFQDLAIVSSDHDDEIN